MHDAQKRSSSSNGSTLPSSSVVSSLQQPCKISSSGMGLGVGMGGLADGMETAFETHAQSVLDLQSHLSPRSVEHRDGGCGGEEAVNDSALGGAFSGVTDMLRSRYSQVVPAFKSGKTSTMHPLTVTPSSTARTSSQPHAHPQSATVTSRPSSVQPKTPRGSIGKGKLGYGTLPSKIAVLSGSVKENKNKQ